MIPPNSYVEMLTPKVMVFRGKGFGRWLGHEGRVLMNGLGTFTKEILRVPLHILPRADTVRKRLSVNTEMPY